MTTSNLKKSDLVEYSPLDSLSISPRGGVDAEVILKECRHAGKLILRGAGNDRKFISLTKKILTKELPTTPNVCEIGKEITSVWLGPDEWLLVTNYGQEKQIEKKLKTALSKLRHAVVDVSDNSTIIQLAGPRARELIMKGCSVDVHPRVFGPGSAVQTNLAYANIIFWQIDKKPSYNLIVRASFAVYLWNWLLDAASEFNTQIEV